MGTVACILEESELLASQKEINPVVVLLDFWKLSKVQVIACTIICCLVGVVWNNWIQFLLQNVYCEKRLTTVHRCASQYECDYDIWLLNMHDFVDVKNE
jgi:hypothetical protein